jgi:hypothetical protein
MKQSTVQKMISECGKAIIAVDNDMSLGAFHDFLMQVKGIIVDMMVKSHQQQQQEADKQKEIDNAPPVTDESSKPIQQG